MTTGNLYLYVLTGYVLAVWRGFRKPGSHACWIRAPTNNTLQSQSSVVARDYTRQRLASTSKTGRFVGVITLNSQDTILRGARVLVMLNWKSKSNHIVNSVYLNRVYILHAVTQSHQSSCCRNVITSWILEYVHSVTHVDEKHIVLLHRLFLILITDISL